MLRKIPSLTNMQNMVRPISTTQSTQSIPAIKVPTKPTVTPKFGFAADMQQFEKYEKRFIGHL